MENEEDREEINSCRLDSKVPVSPIGILKEPYTTICEMG